MWFSFFSNHWGLCHNFSNIMGSVLAITSANSLRTPGHNCSFPMGLCRFRFLRWSQTPTPPKGKDWVCPVPALRLNNLRDVGRVWVKPPQPSPCWLPLDFLSYLLGVGEWVYFLNSCFSDQCPSRSSSFGSSNSSTNSQLQMCFIFPDAMLATPLCSSQDWVLIVLHFHQEVPAQSLFHCLTCLISHTRESKVLVL